jgi:16S rRNA (cytosine1402-N4)-methyltransferase
MHTPVLLSEVLTGLSLKPDDIVVDATAGAGGHSEAICRTLGPEGMLVALDADASAVERLQKRLTELAPVCKYTVINTNFRNLDRGLAEAGVEKVTKALFDLGLSSDQLELSGRGFSFQADEPLIMTFKDGKGESGGDEAVTARSIVSEWDESSIADVLYYYGDERFARRIAREIVARRHVEPIETTHDLVRIIGRAVPRRGQSRLHPATKTFQALRIAVNDEIGALREGLARSYEHLATPGRLLVISFHSIEDRIVKRFMKARVSEGAVEIAKKPIIPGKTELALNPRSRSAKLRILEKI